MILTQKELGDLQEVEKIAEVAIEFREAQLALLRLTIPPKYWGKKHGARLPFDAEAYDKAELRLKQATADFNRIVDRAITSKENVSEVREGN